ncbi:MAG: SDR family oxidoreductase [Anaerolineales bacterium]|jgi:NAD(P)-dependent dehydrogenase (short-subunit alcohol dehydrogenase family)|nr:SDR family oxidoreductase [Anaerolineales bacterium]
MEPLSFADQVVLITGAGRGLGRALAAAFAAQGANIAAVDLNPIGIEQTLAEVKAAGGLGSEYIFDVAKRLPVQALLDQVLEDWGRVDILINNAAVEPVAAILDMDEWDWHRTLDVNLSGAFFTIQHAGRAMRAQGRGVIINMGASEAYVSGRPHRIAYAASKAGLTGLTRYAARELAPYHIRVLAVCPDAADTESLRLAKDYPTVPIPDMLLSLDVITSTVLELCHPNNNLTGEIIDIPILL